MIKENNLHAEKPAFEADEEGFVNFYEVAQGVLRQQAQYASEYIHGKLSRPKLSDGLRFKGDPLNYHNVKIHRDDIEEFVRRVEAYRNPPDESEDK